MRRVYCDRCGNEIMVPNYFSVCMERQTGVDSCELDLCETCVRALKRFLGVNTRGGGYEQLDSEIGGDEK